MYRLFSSPYVTFNFPGSPSALYSLRLANTSYTGNCVNVRRKSDNTTLDIAFQGNHMMDISSFNTFTANTIGFVTKWYDQSGNGLDMIQSSNTNQPLIFVTNNQPFLTFLDSYMIIANSTQFAGDQTIGATIWQADLNAPLWVMSQFDGSNGWLFGLNQTGGYGTYYAGGFMSTNNNIMERSLTSFSITRSSNNVSLFVNGNNAGTGTGGSLSTTANLEIGGYNNGSPTSQFLMNECYVYNSALSNSIITSIHSSEESFFTDTLKLTTPYTGNSWLQFSTTDYITLGSNVLTYEYTQPWTAYMAVQSIGHTAQFGQIIFTNVSTNSNVNGYEFWFDGADQGYDGTLRVRIIANYGGNIYIDTKGSTNIVDGKKHFVAASYNGSGFANGVSIYVDGIPETVTILKDNLAGNTIVSNTQLFQVGSQNGALAPVGPFGYFQLDNTARSSSYIAAHSTPASLPPIDSNTVICFPMNEGSGTTINDTSGNHRNGTLSSSLTWIPFTG